MYIAGGNADGLFRCGPLFCTPGVSEETEWSGETHVAWFERALYALGGGSVSTKSLMGGSWTRPVFEGCTLDTGASMPSRMKKSSD